MEHKNSYSSSYAAAGVDVTAVSKETADAAIKALTDAGEKAFVLGEVIEGDEGVILC